jgi:hypothetical protein
LFAHQHLPSKEDYLSVDIGCRKNSYLPEPLHLIPKKHEFKDKCPRCNANRYKWNDNIEEDSYNNKRKGRKRKNTAPPDQDNRGSKERKVPALVMWYLPIIDCLKRMFSYTREAQLLLWHVQRKRDGKIRHPANGRQWKHFYLSHEDFSNDPRNIRFDLSTDGMNPFREIRNPYSTWTVILYIYNLPPWLCHKRKYLLLTTLISDPKQAGIDIDVSLEPLMEDMQKLQEHGANVWDEYKKEHFNLNAIILCMINDNPTHLALTGQVKGKTGCVICVDQTVSIYLLSSSKVVYMRHCRFLPPKHRYHQ